MAQSKRGMVEKIDFYTSFGHGEGGDHRKRLGIDTRGADAAHHRSRGVASRIRRRKEFTVVSLHPGVTREHVQETCGWPVAFRREVARRRRRPSWN